MEKNFWKVFGKELELAAAGSVVIVDLREVVSLVVLDNVLVVPSFLIVVGSMGKLRIPWLQ